MRTPAQLASCNLRMMSRVVDVYVSYLRRKIDADYPTKLIHTVWGVGWVLREEV